MLFIYKYIFYSHDACIFYTWAIYNRLKYVSSSLCTATWQVFREKNRKTFFPTKIAKLLKSEDFQKSCGSFFSVRNSSSLLPYSNLKLYFSIRLISDCTKKFQVWWAAECSDNILVGNFLHSYRALSLRPECLWES